MAGNFGRHHFYSSTRQFAAGCLTGLGAMLIGRRVAALNEITIVSYRILAAFVAFVLQFSIYGRLGPGLFTRLAGPCAALHELIATLSGGGWEYRALTMALFLSFTFSGSGAFSLDRALIGARRIPRAMMIFSVSRNAPHLD